EASVLLSALSALAAANNHLVTGLAFTRAALKLTPRRHRVTAAGCLALTAAVRVVKRVHHDAANLGTLALPAVASRLAPTDVDLFGVADFADTCAAAHVNVAHFTGGQAQLGSVPLFSGKLDACSRGATHLGAATGAHFYRVQHRTPRNIAQRQIITDRDVGLRTGFNGHILLEAVGGDDVAFLAVGVMQQCDTRRAIGVILDLSDT